MARTVQGKTHTWRMSDAPIGSGDAGEVYTVACVEQPKLLGVMKKPTRIATGGTIQRQANQIAQESLALARLDGLPRGKAHPPRLLDQAPEFTQGTANYFIVSETAPGEDMASLLAQTRQSGKPFPRRVIITVLDALFDLFSRAHKAGVLWNDVKLDHIYWHNPTGQVAVIDWGNALFLNEEESGERRPPPRWEDYQQMVDTLGGFLQRSAPELYADLGWREFQGQVLDLQRISVLARRIAYQQQVVALKVMEYQSLIRVVLSERPTLYGLQKIREYQQILEQIGAPWEQEGILSYSQSLVEKAVGEGEKQTAVRVTTLVWDVFDETLDLPWHLLREYFRDPEILTHRNMADLSQETLREKWPRALWNLITIARDVPNPTWWDGLVPVLRQKALGSRTPPPYQSCQTLLDWTETQGPQRAKQAYRIKTILQNWRVRGEDLLESPFDYELLDLLGEEKNFPHRILIELKKNFSDGREVIRELFQAWIDAEWDQVAKALRRVASWDPDRWGIIPLSDNIESFRAWMKNLYDGPAPGTKIQAFIQQSLADRPHVERQMGKPPWLNTLLTMLEAINQGALIHDYRPGVEKWCPWLLNYADIYQDDLQTTMQDDAAIHVTLSHFVKHLKTWSDVDAGLAMVKENLPEFHPLCSKLVTGFQNILSFNLDTNLLESGWEKSIHPELAESVDALQIFFDWRNYISKDQLDAALEPLSDQVIADWQILKHTREETTRWRAIILPTLDAIQSFKPDTSGETTQVPQKLMEVSTACKGLLFSWSQIYQAGLYQSLLESLEESIESARTAFFDWRQSYERYGNRVGRLLYHSHLNLINPISENLLRLSQDIRQAKLDYAVLVNGNEVSPAMQIKSAENLLDHLGAIESTLITEPDDRRFPEWQTNFQNLFDTLSTEKRQQMVLTFSDDHPLYTWLVQSVFAGAH